MGWMLPAEVAVVSPADEAYVQAVAAWHAGDWDGARGSSLAALAIEPGHPEARLLHAYTLLRIGRTADGVAALEAIARDPEVVRAAPEVAELAQDALGQLAGRWTRDEWSLSAGPLGRPERAGGYASWQGGLAFEMMLPVVPRLGVRLDVTTPFSALDALSLQGPVLSALAVGMQPLGSGIWHLDLGVGPSVWVGKSLYWDDRYKGLFPGVRSAVGLDLRAWQYVGFRLEGGYTAHYGARQGLDLWTDGFDLRLLTTGYHHR